jgi:hypothetical protein
MSLIDEEPDNEFVPVCLGVDGRWHHKKLGSDTTLCGIKTIKDYKVDKQQNVSGRHGCYECSY